MQQGTPDELYGHPANEFVAGFLGTPQINLFSCTVRQENGGLILDAGDFRFKAPENLKACLAPHEAAGEAFNIAYGGREFLIDIYYGLAKALGVNIEPNFGPDRKGDIKHSNADISKAKKLLGYAPDYSFEDGISLAIDWYKENL